MLNHLFDWLQGLGLHIPGAGLFHFLSFRAMLAAVISMLIAYFAGGRMIKLLRKEQIGEDIRDLGLEGQMQKKGTPTMGGLIIIAAMLGSALLVCRLDSIYTLLLVVTTLWCGAIGFAVYLDTLERLQEPDGHPDADILLVYPGDAAPEAVLNAVSRLGADGATVCAQKTVPGRARFGRRVDLSESGVT